MGIRQNIQRLGERLAGCVNCTKRRKEKKIREVERAGRRTESSRVSYSPEFASMFKEFKKREKKAVHRLERSGKLAAAVARKPALGTKCLLGLLAEVVWLYFRAETLAILVAKELFNPKCLKRPARERRQLIKLLDSFCRELIRLDCAKYHYSECFCLYSELKLKEQLASEGSGRAGRKRLGALKGESERGPSHGMPVSSHFTAENDFLLSFIAATALPFGRQLLTLFTSASAEPFYPSILGRRARFPLDGRAAAALESHARHAERQRLLSACVFLAALRAVYTAWQPAGIETLLGPDKNAYYHILTDEVADEQRTSA